MVSDRSCEKALQSSQYVRQSVQEFGFLLAEEKCQWLPKLQVTWLSYLICMDSGIFFITDDQIKALEFSCKSMLYQLGTQKLKILTARFVASLTGQIISMHAVLGKIIRLRTRELYKCIDSRLSWDSQVYISEKAEHEVRFWLESVRIMNLKGRDFVISIVFETMYFCDASSEGYRGYLDISEYQNSELVKLIALEVSKSRKSVTSKVVKGLPEKVRVVDTTEVVKSVTSEVDMSVAPEEARSVTPEAVKSVTPEVVKSVILKSFKSVTPNLLMSVDHKASQPVAREEAKSSTPEVVKSVTPEVVKSVTPEVVKSVNQTLVKYVTSEVEKSIIPEVVNSEEANESETLEKDVIGVGNKIERSKSSTWKEAEAVKRVLIGSDDQLRGKRVKVFSDNKNVQSSSSFRCRFCL